MALKKNKPDLTVIFKKTAILLFCIITVFLLSRPLLTKLHAFLALTKPVKTDVLIVEGWLFDYMLDFAVEEINKSDYKLIITTGKIVYKNTSSKNTSLNQADYCRDRLIERGIAPAKIVALSANDFKYHTTYHTALVTKQWLISKKIDSVNVYTGGPHGRKTYLLYKEALGPDINVGVISCKIKHYDPVKWWTSMRGTWVTLRYTIGYLYALIFPFQILGFSSI